MAERDAGTCTCSTIGAVDIRRPGSIVSFVPEIREEEGHTIGRKRSLDVYRHSESPLG